MTVVTLLEIAAGLAIGFVLLAAVAWLSLRAGEKPMRTRDSSHDFDALWFNSDARDPP